MEPFWYHLDMVFKLFCFFACSESLCLEIFAAVIKATLDAIVENF